MSSRPTSGTPTSVSENSLLNEFKIYAAERGWQSGSKRYRKEWQRWRQVGVFTAHYGSDENRLEGWKALCADVGIEHIPNTITQCKKVLRSSWVNIVDLIECRRMGKQVKRHSSQNALRNYTRNSGKIFPKAAAKRNGFLNALLITIW